MYKIKKEIEPDLQPIMDLCTDMLKYRDKIESLRQTKLKVNTPNANITPQYSFCILEDTLWNQYSTKIQNKTVLLSKAVGFK